MPDGSVQQDARVAVVTGGARGIGAAIARRFGADGFAVVILDIDIVGASGMAASLGGRAIACDVSDHVAVRVAAEAIGRIDVLVNNAGIAFPGSILESRDEELTTVVNTNMMGLVHCARAFAPALMAS